MYTPLWLLRNLAIKEVNWYPFFYGNKRLEPLVCVRTPLTAILASETVLSLICTSWVVHGILELPPTCNTRKANSLWAFLQKTYNVGQKNLGFGGKTLPSNIVTQDSAASNNVSIGFGFVPSYPHSPARQCFDPQEDSFPPALIKIQHCLGWSGVGRQLYWYQWEGPNTFDLHRTLWPPPRCWFIQALINRLP